MKTVLKIYCITALLMLSVSCNKEVSPEKDNGTLKITGVRQTGFTPAVSSRASHTDGYATVFEENDRLGLILLDANGGMLDNIPYTYTGGNWENPDVVYSPEISRIIAYFPYNENLPQDVTTIDALKASVEIVTNQSSAEDFAKMDLLVCEIDDVSKDIYIAFSHAFSLFTLSSASAVTVGNETFVFNTGMEDVSLVVGPETYIPCNIEGSNHWILKDGTELQPERFKYIYSETGGNRYTKTVSAAVTTAPGTCYDLPYFGEEREDAASAGDYFCVSDATGNTVLIPGNAAALPEGLTCKGIVFYTMDSEAFGGYASENGLDPDDYAGYDGSHGLVVSLANGGSLGSAGDFSDFLLTSVEGWDSREALNGYRMTEALREAVSAGTITSFTALDGHGEPASAVSTPWFAPSFMELAVLVRGGDGAAVSNDGLVLVNARLGKLGAAEISTGNIPTVTFGTNEQSQNIIWFVTGGSGAEFSYSFAGTNVPGETFRPICAF